MDRRPEKKDKKYLKTDSNISSNSNDRLKWNRFGCKFCRRCNPLKGAFVCRFFWNFPSVYFSASLLLSHVCFHSWCLSADGGGREGGGGQECGARWSLVYLTDTGTGSRERGGVQPEVWGPHWPPSDSKLRGK